MLILAVVGADAAASENVLNEARGRELLLRNIALLDNDLSVAADQSLATYQQAHRAGLEAIAGAALMQHSCAQMGMEGAKASLDSFQRALREMPPESGLLEHLVFMHAMDRRFRYFGRPACAMPHPIESAAAKDESIDANVRLQCLFDLNFRRGRAGKEESPWIRRLARDLPRHPVHIRMQLSDNAGAETRASLSQLEEWLQSPEFPGWPRRLRIDVLSAGALLYAEDGQIPGALGLLESAIQEARLLRDKTLLCRCERQRSELQRQLDPGTVEDAFSRVAPFLSAVSDADLLRSLFSLAAGNRKNQKKTHSVAAQIAAQIATVQSQSSDSTRMSAVREELIRRILDEKDSHLTAVIATSEQRQQRTILIIGISVISLFVLMVVVVWNQWQLRKATGQLNDQIRQNHEHSVAREKIEFRMAQIDRLDSLGSLAGGIAHDFNNLLVGVMGNADLLRHTVACPTVQSQQCLDGIMQSAQTAAELSRKMLAYAGRTPSEAEQIELNEMIRRMIPLLQSGLRGCQNIEFCPNHEPLFTIGDVAQLEQILLNLVTNACQAAADHPEPVRIRLGTCEITSPPVDVPTFGRRTTGGQFVWFEVSDSGKGIPESHLGRIFEPFFTTNPDSSGHGFGLAVVYGHVNRHRGLIQVQSAPGVGTRFRILLPAFGGLPQEHRDMECDPKGWRLVVIDPDPQLAEAFRVELSDFGCEVVTFPSGVEALEYIASGNSVDAIFMNHQLPVMRASEVLEVLMEKQLAIPVIQLAAQDSASGDVMQTHPYFRGRVSIPPNWSEVLQILRQISAENPRAARLR